MTDLGNGFAYAFLVALFSGASAVVVTRLLPIQRLDRAWKRMLYFAAVCAGFFVISLMSFDDTSVGRLAEIDRRLLRLEIDNHCYDAKSQDVKRSTKTQVGQGAGEIPPGCALVVRAYKLGYTKSLGDCRPRAPQPRLLGERVCRRAGDVEPLLHHAARKLAHYGGQLRAKWSTLGAGWRGFVARLERLGPLASRFYHVLKASPKSAIHIWTDLPAPTNSSLCSAGGLSLATRGVSDSDRLQAAVAQLLWQRRRGAAVANCRRVWIHWHASPKTCLRLRTDPTAFLSDSSASATIDAAISRDAAARAIRAMNRELDGERVAADSSVHREPRAIEGLSAHCLWSTKAAAEAPALSFADYRGYRIPVVEGAIEPAASRANADDTVAIYSSLARVLAAGFRYRPLPGEAVYSPDAAGLTALRDPDFPLTALEQLRARDPFLGEGWTLSYSGLRPAPVEHYVDKYVTAFRSYYRGQSEALVDHAHSGGGRRER